MLGTDMKDVSISSAQTTNKKLPWRRRYQDVKVANLLHTTGVQVENKLPPDYPRYTSQQLLHAITQQPCTSKNCESTAEEIIFENDNLTNGHNKGCRDTFQHPIIFKPPKNAANAVAGVTEDATILKGNVRSLNGAIKYDRKDESVVANQGKTIFQQYLHIPSLKMKQTTENRANTTENLNGYSELAEVKRVTKTRRPERRHTVSGASPINMQDIEDWISQERELKDKHKSKDDCEIFVAKTHIVRTKLAENKANFNWRKRREGYLPTVREEGEAFMHRRLDEKEKKNSWREISAEGRLLDMAEPTLEGNRAYAISGDGEFNGKDVKSQSKEEALTTATNNERLSCFLTPRPYSKPAAWSAMSLTRRSWNGYDVIINSEEERSKSAQGFHGRNGKMEAEYLEDDDDIFLGGGDEQKSRDSKYDTFLDLSRLNLEEEESPSSSSSSEGETLTSSSDPESEEEAREADDEGEGRKDEEEVAGVVSFLLNGTLDKIEEEQTDEEDKITDFPLEVVDERERPTDVEVPSDIIDDVTEKGGSGIREMPRLDESRRENTSQCANRDQGGATHSEDIKAASDSSKPEPPLNTSQLPQERIRVETGKFEIETSVDQSSESDRSSETDDVSTDDVSANDEHEFQRPPMDKTTSLDRSAFLKLPNPRYTVTKRKSMPAEYIKPVRSVEQSIANTSGDNAKDPAALRAGLKRLFQIAISTVDGKRRPGAKIKDVLDLIESKGIKLSDPRMRESFLRMETEAIGAESPLDIEVFSRVCEPCFKFIRSVLLSQLTIPGFNIFKLRMSRIFENIEEILNGQNDVTNSIDPCSSYNVIMRKLRTGKPHISMSVCTVDGQRCSFGDTETPQPLNACASVFNYCLACRQNGTETMSRYVGRRCRPELKNEFSLEPCEKVWNPFTTAGSFVTTSLLFREMAQEKRLDTLHEFYGSMTGNEPLCCDNLSYNYKRTYAHEDIGLAYYLSATQRLPRGASADLADTLDFHFQAASSAMTSDGCAIGAATLANGGVCPLTGETVLDKHVTNHTLHVMRSSFTVTSPRSEDKKQDIAAAWSDHGSILLVIPGVLGVTCFVQCQSKDAIKQVVDKLLSDLNSNFNFSVYRSLKDHRNLFFRR